MLNSTFEVQPRTIFQNTYSTHVGQASMKIMAKKAYSSAMKNAKSTSLSSDQVAVVINSVHGALKRASINPQFSQLPEDKQKEAATRLAEQFIEGQKLVNALKGAMENPATLTAQLLNNTSEKQERNVFKQIVDLNTPRTPISPSSVQHMGSFNVA